MRIGIGTKVGSFPITVLLTFNITFVFYDGIAINREWPTLRRCDGEQRQNNDAPIDDPDITNVVKKLQIRKCRRVDDRISIRLTQIS
jgi:hypothetical protein